MKNTSGPILPVAALAITLAAGLLLPLQVLASCTASPDLECLLEHGARRLANIDDPASQVDGVVELAKARVAAGLNAQAYVALLEAGLTAAGQADPDSRGFLLASVSQAMADHSRDQSDLGSARNSAQHMARHMAKAALLAAAQLPALDRRADLTGKALVALAGAGKAEQALSQAMAMSADNSSQAAYKARTLKALAALRAETDLARGRQIFQTIDMGITYYQATGAVELALLALKNHDQAAARELLEMAVEIARTDPDGYFVAGALREAAMANLAAGNSEAADRLVQEALAGARNASSAQQKARAVSRIASDLADAGRYQQARELLPQSEQLARMEASVSLRMWSFYELAGAAAAAGDFDTAGRLLAEIDPGIDFSGRSLLSAAQRDVAWGMARHGKLDRALLMAETIESAREKVQALSRIVRVMVDPEMKALPRYL